MKKEVTVEMECADIFVPFLKPARYKVAEGGRGGGKSHFFARKGILEVLSGKRMLCCREVQVSIKQSVKSLLASLIVTMGLNEYFTILDQEIRCNISPGYIAFSGLRQTGPSGSAAENLKSYEGFDICWVEEAQTISKTSLDILLPTIRKKGSEVWFSYNRKLDNEPVHRKFVEADVITKGTIHIYVNWWDNPWFTTELRTLMESDRANSMDDYNHIWRGLPQKRSKATIFTRWRIAECEPGPKDKLYHGLDFGFFPDPCMFLRCWLDWDLKRIYIDHAHYAVKLDPEMIGPKLLKKIPGSKKHKILADNARPEIISQLNGNYKIEAAPKGPGSIELGIEWLQAWEIWVHPRCEEIDDKKYPHYNIVEELRNYKRKICPQTGDVLPKIIDDYNHGMDGLRYALSDLIRKTGGVDYVKMMGNQSSNRKAFERQLKIAQKQAAHKLLIPETISIHNENLKKDNKTIFVKASTLGLKLPGQF